MLFAMHIAQGESLVDEDASGMGFCGTAALTPLYLAFRAVLVGEQNIRQGRGAVLLPHGRRPAAAQRQRGGAGRRLRAEGHRRPSTSLQARAACQLGVLLRVRGRMMLLQCSVKAYEQAMHFLLLVCEQEVMTLHDSLIWAGTAR